MEPVSLTVGAILAALTAGVASGMGKAAGENMVIEAYQGLKDMLKRKFGGDSEVVKAVETVEEDPDSEWRKGMLKEKAKVAGVDRDPEMRRAAQDLLDRVKALPGGEQHVMNAVGSYIAQADRGSTASVDVHKPKEQEGP